MKNTIEQLLSQVQLIPVAVINQPNQAVPLAQALLAAGIKTIEVTLRTGAALHAIEQIANHVPELVVGAGSVVDSDQMSAVASAGAQYAISPGFTEELLAIDTIPYLPGASTAAEVMHLRSRGYFFQKFFPAEPMGGLATLKAIHAPLSDVKFCPTGGITAPLSREYLAEEFIFAVGGSWFLDLHTIEQGDTDAITTQAKHALASVNHD